MPVLHEDSVLIMDGAVKLYRRERSCKWQAASGNSTIAEGQVLEVVCEPALSVGFGDDEVIDTSITSGKTP